MSQDWVADLYTVGTVGDTTLSNMELMFATLRSSFSGGSTPSNPVDGNLYYDTGSDLLKAYRNAGWAGVLVGSASFKMWAYLDAAEDGWSIDATSVTDRVLAFKGGSTYVTGGGNAGTWTQPSHTLLTAEIPVHTHSMSGTGTHKHDIYCVRGGSDSIDAIFYDINLDNDIWYQTETDGGHSHAIGDYGGGGSHSHGGAAYRPDGAVGTLQYPDMT